MLSDRFIRNAKPGLYADEEGLYLKVFPSGKRSFVVRTRTNGKDSTRTLGQYPSMGLSEARRALRRPAGERTVKEAFDEYYAHLKTQYKRPEQVKRMFDADVLPNRGDTPLSTLQRADWVAVVERILKRGRPVMANRTLTAIKNFLDFCEQRGWVDENPTAPVKRKAIGGKEKAKSRTLSFDEIRQAFLLQLTPGTAWTLYGVLLTGQRPTEVLNITPEGRVFTKMQRWHQVPMTPHVRHWLASKPADIPKDHRVLSHAIRRLKQTFTPHDLRRTFASRLADLGVAPHVIEKLLDHKMEGVMAVYNHATYWPERIAAQKLWDRTIKKTRRLAGS